MKPITNDKIKTLNGVLFYMTVVDLPTRRIYWLPQTWQNVTADAMTINPFEEILSVLHANNNELMKDKGEPGYDKLHKLRSLIEMTNLNFIRNAEHEL